jgi:VWFA-related protein
VGEVIAAALLMAALVQAPDRPRFAVDVESVSVDVFVTRGARPVPGLTAADFEVKDEGVLQTVEVVDLTLAPIGAVLALDASGSVEGAKLEGLRAAATAFVAGLAEADEAALVTFSHVVALQAGPTRDRRALETAMRRVRAGGSTALFDALYAALRLPLGAPRRVVLLFTDGSDNVSVLGIPDVEDYTAAADVLLYVVASPEEVTPAPLGALLIDREPAARRELRLLAESTGGRLLEAGSPEDLRRQFLRILDDLRTRYVLSFTPTGVRREGTHRLDVRVKARDTQVRARRSYRAPRRPAP